MRDMDALRAELAGRALRHRAQAEFGAGEGGVADAAAQAGSGAGKEDVPRPRGSISRAASRAGQEAGVAGHLPDLAEDPLGRLEQREIDVGADVEDADLQRRRCVGRPQEGGDLLLLAGVERTADDPPARRLDLRDQRRQLLAVAPSGENGKAFAGEFPGDRGADEVAGANHRDRGIPGFHVRLQRPG